MATYDKQAALTHLISIAQETAEMSAMLLRHEDTGEDITVELANTRERIELDCNELYELTAPFLISPRQIRGGSLAPIPREADSRIESVPEQCGKAIQYRNGNGDQYTMYCTRKAGHTGIHTRIEP